MSVEHFSWWYPCLTLLQNVIFIIPTGFQRFLDLSQTEVREAGAKLNPTVTKAGSGTSYPFPVAVYVSKDAPAPSLKTDAQKRQAARESDVASRAGVSTDKHPLQQSGVHGSHAFIKIPYQTQSRPNALHHKSSIGHLCHGHWGHRPGRRHLFCCTLTSACCLGDSVQWQVAGFAWPILARYLQAFQLVGYFVSLQMLQVTLCILRSLSVIMQDCICPVHAR